MCLAFSRGFFTLAADLSPLLFSDLLTVSTLSCICCCSAWFFDFHGGVELTRGDFPHDAAHLQHTKQPRTTSLGSAATGELHFLESMDRGFAYRESGCHLAV